MKRSIALLAALCVACGIAAAQETALDPDEAYVLEKARQKLSQPSGSSGPATSPGVESTPSAPQAEPQSMESSGTSSASSAPSAPPQAASQSITVFQSDSTVVRIEIQKEGRVRQEPEGRPYFPFVLSFVPGLSFPPGTYDTSLAYGAIGSAVGSVYGVQGAGVFSIAEDQVAGVQGSGVFGTASRVLGVQGSGVFSIADSVEGAQASGVFNIADRVEGAQVAGVFNIAGRMDGFQAAGVFNVADKASGAMIGLVNIADELDGVAIGLVNIIGNGINDIGVDYQFASGNAYATLRSGTPFLYATLYAGIPATDLGTTAERMTFGGGIGHRFKVLFMSLDAELGTETIIDPAAVSALSTYLVTGDYHPLMSLNPADRTFGSLRLSLGFGERRGFGPYVGVKTDFALAGSSAIPERLRSSFGSTAPYALSLFGYALEFWPKWFVGIQF